MARMPVDDEMGIRRICVHANVSAHGLAHPRYRAEIVVRLHQVAEAGLVLHRHGVDGHLRKNHHGFLAPAVASRHSYQGADRKSSIAVKCQIRQILVRRGESSKHKSAFKVLDGFNTQCIIFADHRPNRGNAFRCDEIG